MATNSSLKYKKILITGGAGFVGSCLALHLKKDFPNSDIFCLDNLVRRGSELNIPRLQDKEITFNHGDIRNQEDIARVGEFDLLIECAAEPSVLAGVHESPAYVVDTNLGGAVNCFEAARQHQADIIFLSSSRIYPIKELEHLRFTENKSRFTLSKKQPYTGASEEGIDENFPLGSIRSIYGSTKLAAEFLLQEYIATYGIRGVINRCGVITGPWQMGKVDQGVIVLWMARHIFRNKPLSYIGYGGTGKQVRDFIHIDDLYEVLKIQLRNLKNYSGEVYNIGGGVKNSLSLKELTNLCEKISGNKIKIQAVTKNRPNDIRVYISNTGKFYQKSGWSCKKDAETTLTEIYDWIMANQASLKPILSS